MPYPEGISESHGEVLDSSALMPYPEGVFEGHGGHGEDTASKTLAAQARGKTWLSTFSLPRRRPRRAMGRMATSASPTTGKAEQANVPAHVGARAGDMKRCRLTRLDGVR